MNGKIIKGISGFYYVHVQGKGIYECKAKGNFRQKKMKPLVGDLVTIDVLDEEKKLGNMIEIKKRKNELIRPAVANIDQAVLIFALEMPTPNFNLLDRFLLMMEYQNIPVVLCFNKVDLVNKETIHEVEDIYKNSGCEIIYTSTKSMDGLEQLKEVLEGKTSTVAGPSGVGKSSIINLISSGVQMETGEISKKIQRGKHTTRHTQFIHINEETYIMDTPGFSSLMVPDVQKEDLKDYYEEFIPYQQECRFLGCTHIHEPNCRVKEALEEGKISKKRYENYKLFYEEIQNRKKY